MKKRLVYSLLIAIAIVVLAIALQYLMEVSGFIRYYYNLYGIDYSAVIRNYYGSYFRIALAIICPTVILCIGTNFIYKEIFERN